NKVSLYANGVRPLSVTGYNKGDVFRIMREGSVIKYYHNYKLLYTATGAPTGAMYMDIEVNKWNSGVVNARASFGGPAISQVTAWTTTRRFDYDHAGRLLSTHHKVNNEDAVILSKNIYNEIGQLTNKGLHSSNPAEYAHAVDYRYNIR